MTLSSEQREIVILDTPDQSPFDKQQYRLIRLPNGIKCLLISPHDGTKFSGQTSTTTSITDEESADEYLAACAVGVDVGSYSDPPDACGMAHFLGKCHSNTIRSAREFNHSRPSIVRQPTDYRKEE